MDDFQVHPQGELVYSPSYLSTNHALPRTCTSNSISVAFPLTRAVIPQYYRSFFFIPGILPPSDSATDSLKSAEFAFSDLATVGSFSTKSELLLYESSTTGLLDSPMSSADRLLT